MSLIQFTDNVKDGLLKFSAMSKSVRIVKSMYKTFSLMLIMVAYNIITLFVVKK